MSSAYLITTHNITLNGDSSAKLGIYKLPHYEFEKAHFHKIIEQKKSFDMVFLAGRKMGADQAMPKYFVLRRASSKDNLQNIVQDLFCCADKYVNKYH